MDPPLIDAKQIISKLERRLNILRNAGAVADYRIVQSSDRLLCRYLLVTASVVCRWEGGSLAWQTARARSPCY